jgi:hypothetical protein
LPAWRGVDRHDGIPRQPGQPFLLVFVHRIQFPALAVLARLTSATPVLRMKPTPVLAKTGSAANRCRIASPSSINSLSGIHTCSGECANFRGFFFNAFMPLFIPLRWPSGKPGKTSAACSVPLPPGCCREKPDPGFWRVRAKTGRHPSPGPVRLKNVTPPSLKTVRQGQAPASATIRQRGFFEATPR